MDGGRALFHMGNANGVGSRFRTTTNHLENALPENDSRPGVFEFVLVKANWFDPVFVPFPPPTGPAPVEARFGNYRAPRHRIPPPTGPAPQLPAQSRC
jgi:hypothetical protein